MKNQVILAVLTVFMVGLIASCTKKDTVPVSPIVGQWDISRITRAGLVAPYTTGNQSFTTNLGTDSYVYNADGTYSDTYSISSGALNNESGVWVFVTPVVTLTPTAQAGQPSTSYSLNYSSSANELSTGAFTVADTLTNPTTNKKEPVKYTLEYVYKKKQ